MCDFAKLGSGILAYVCNFVFLVGLVWQKKLSAKEIQELEKGERNVPLIIDFYATWCGPCILMAQELEMVGYYFRVGLLTKLTIAMPGCNTQNL